MLKLHTKLLAAAAVLFSASLCFCLVGCANASPDYADCSTGNGAADTVTLDLSKDASTQTGNVLSLVEGVVYDTELPAELHVSVPAALQMIPLSDDRQLLIDSVSYCLAEGERISALYSNAILLGADGSLQWDATCSGDHLSDDTRQEAISLVANAFSLAQTGCSAASTEPFLAPPASASFAALYFYPRIVRIQGRIVDASAAELSSITLEYPCVNLLGCLDGTYQVMAVSPEVD